MSHFQRLISIFFLLPLLYQRPILAQDVESLKSNSVQSIYEQESKVYSPLIEDIYLAKMVDKIKKGEEYEDKRQFDPTVQNVFWIGISLINNSPKPIKAIWENDKGKRVETKVLKFEDNSFKAILPNKIAKFLINPGRWTVKIQSAKGEVVDKQVFYIGDIDVAFENRNISSTKIDLTKEDAVVVSTKREVLVFDNYGSIERVTKRLKVLTDKGKEMVEVRVPFIDQVEKIYLLYAYTINPNGKLINANQYAVQTFATNYPNFSAYQIFTMTMPSLEKGSIIEFSYILTSNEPKAKGIFADYFIVRDILPILSKTYIINVAKSLKLKYKELNLKLDITHRNLPGIREEYIFKSQDNEGIKLESYMPNWRDFVGELILTTSNSWDDIAMWWQSIIKNKSDVTPEIQTYVNELIKGAKSKKEIVQRIYQDVSMNVRYVGLDFGATIYDPIPASEVFKNKYGDCKDQSMLLLAMLKAAGIEAYSVLAHSGLGDTVQQIIPTINEFNHVFVVAIDGDQQYYLDPTLKHYPMGIMLSWLDNRYVMQVRDGKAKFDFISKTPADKNKLITKIQLIFDDKFNIKGQAKINWIGEVAGDVRAYLYSLKSDKERHEYVSIILKDMYSYANLEAFTFINEKDLDKNLKLTIDFRLDNWLQEFGKEGYLFRMIGGEIRLPDYLEKKRIYPVLLNRQFTEINQIKIKIPDGFNVETPDPFELSNEFFKTKIKYVINKNQLIARNETQVLKTDIPLSKIEMNRLFWEKFIQENRKNVVLKKIKVESPKVLTEMDNK